MGRKRPIYGQRDDRVPDQLDLMTRSIQVRADSVDEETRTAEATLSTQNPVEVMDWNRYEVIDEVLLVDGARMPPQIVLLDAHSRFQVANVRGSVTNIRKTDSGIVGTLRFASDADSERAWQLVREGHLTDVSVGYRVDNYVDIPAGKSQDVGGRTYTAKNKPLRVATEWRLREVSLVPIGADEEAKIREMARARHRNSTEAHEMNPELLKFLGLRADASDSEAYAKMRELEGDKRQRAIELNGGKDAPPETNGDAGRQTQSQTAPATQNQPQDGQRNAQPQTAQTQPSGQSDDGQRSDDQMSDNGRQDAARAERADEILSLAATAGMPSDEARALINDQNLTVRAAAERIINWRDNRATPPIGRSGDRRDLHGLETRLAMSAAVMEHIGLRADSMQRPIGLRMDDDEWSQLRERAINDANRFRFRHTLDLCEIALRESGRSTTVATDEDLVREAVSTSYLQHVFTDSVNAQAAEAFDNARDTTDWAGSRDVRDFKDSKAITLGATSGMARVARGGKAELATWSDKAETGAAIRYGERFAIDEQDMIDDMLGLLADLPTELLADASELRPRLVYAAMLKNANMAEDSTALFDSSTHANLTTAALSGAAFQAAVVAMSKQTKLGGRLADIMPEWLIVPTDLQVTGWQILNSIEQRETGDGSTSDAYYTMNPFVNYGMKLRADARLGAAGVVDPITGTTYTGTATNWFLAGPRKTITVIYRTGTGRRPQTRSYALSNGQWGMGFDINFDIGIRVEDWRGMHKSTGAA
jgi:HK97 family phage prohead protease